jgi:hypothetical protein
MAFDEQETDRNVETNRQLISPFKRQQTIQPEEAPRLTNN